MSRPSRLSPILAAFALSLFACGEGGPDRCVDGTCPANQVCGEDGGCVGIEPPSATGELGRHTRVALRPDGRRVVATWDRTRTNLVLRMERPDGSTETRVVAGWRIVDRELQDTRAGRWPSVAVDDADVVHLAWYDEFDSALRYGRLGPDEELAVETVDGEGSADRGTWTTLALGADGAIHLAYRDETAGRLRYARRDPGGAWATTVIEGCADPGDCDGEAVDYGQYASLVLVAGQPRIAFYDASRGDLKMAARHGDGAWTVTTLDGRDPETGADTGDVGRFARAAVDPKQRVGVAYYDATRGALRFLFSGGPGPDPVVVDDGVYHDEASGALRNHPVGQHVALRFDGRGRAHLIYLDAGRPAMRHAVVQGSSVLRLEDLDHLPAGGYVDFAIDRDERLRGAWGPWRATGDLRTRLETFDLPLEAP